MQSGCRFRAGILSAVIVVLAVCVMQADAASRLTYSLELNGYNHAGDFKQTPPIITEYTRGSGDDGQIVNVDSSHPVNWAVVLKTEGVQSSGNGTGFTTFGAANVVFNLALYQGGSGSTSLATEAVFNSTINDGTNGFPQTAAAFSYSFHILPERPGRIIDPLLEGGPGMSIYSYPFFAPATARLIGMGAGYREWNRSNIDLFTIPGVGMGLFGSDNPMPNGSGGWTDGLGVIPIAEGQIDMSGLPIGTYTLKVIPGLRNNVLRGDRNMNASENQPVFATPADETAGDSITFTVNPCTGCCLASGVVGRYVFYNNSAWDNNTPGITPGDYYAIPPHKTPLLPGGGLAQWANYINYSRGINGIIIDACRFERLPIVNQDLFFLMGNDASTTPENWTDFAPEPNAVELRPGEGMNGSDRLIITWADNAIPNTTWLLTAILADDPSLGLPQTDMFVFGLAIGETNGDFIVDPSDELRARSHRRSALNPAPITDENDVNKDKLVGPQDELIIRSNRTSALSRLKQISW